MIGYLKGKVLRNDGKNILLDVSGVGYDLLVAAETAASFLVGKNAELYTYLHVRENELSLFGFQTEEQLSFFKLVLSVSGVGPKMGIEILSLPIALVKNAIVSEDKTYLKTVSGMGDKLASRVILELKNKVDALPVENTSASGMVSVNMDVVDALERMGYERKNVLQFLQSMEEVIENEEELMKYCLKHL